MLNCRSGTTCSLERSRALRVAQRGRKSSKCSPPLPMPSLNWRLIWTKELRYEHLKLIIRIKTFGKFLNKDYTFSNREIFTVNFHYKFYNLFVSFFESDLIKFHSIVLVVSIRRQKGRSPTLKLLLQSKKLRALFPFDKWKKRKATLSFLMEQKLYVWSAPISTPNISGEHDRSFYFNIIVHL